MPIRGLKVFRNSLLVFKILRNLHTDDALEVFNLNGDNIWLRVKDGSIMYDLK